MSLVPSFLKQADGTMHPAARTAAWVLIAVPLVAGFEGYASKPYVDRIGRGHPATWCFGETGADTHGVIPPMNRYFSKAECTAALQDKLILVYDPAIRKCIHFPMPPHREAALVSAAYNLGPGAVCNGSIARDLNAGRVTVACRTLLAYNRSLGVPRAGLTSRRKEEMTLCLRND